ncbi:hypothetical protein PanWU01x14_132390 [Parasponia andersonii]|uniref:Uncharacterized protein n=1 Tax=Parasponia andersonii TaxID=3476 RepID=A0A2P5CQJ5_PARAD|nr:hypothetical protein PanWU01x14_132390 [Parasponia andersonii]
MQTGFNGKIQNFEYLVILLDNRRPEDEWVGVEPKPFQNPKLDLGGKMMPQLQDNPKFPKLPGHTSKSLPHSSSSHNLL